MRDVIDAYEMRAFALHEGFYLSESCAEGAAILQAWKQALLDTGRDLNLSFAPDIPFFTAIARANQTVQQPDVFWQHGLDAALAGGKMSKRLMVYGLKGDMHQGLLRTSRLETGMVDQGFTEFADGIRFFENQEAASGYSYGSWERLATEYLADVRHSLRALAEAFQENSPSGTAILAGNAAARFSAAAGFLRLEGKRLCVQNRLLVQTLPEVRREAFPVLRKLMLAGDIPTSRILKVIKKFSPDREIGVSVLQKAMVHVRNDGYFKRDQINYFKVRCIMKLNS